METNLLFPTNDTVNFPMSVGSRFHHLCTATMLLVSKSSTNHRFHPPALHTNYPSYNYNGLVKNIQFF
uniref:Putative ovule protein n=1 Tax=Solanum chacoense TaxID=4108 RepID=A0A0V0HFC6_SOLCH